MRRDRYCNVSYILLEYGCPACGERIESLEPRSEPAQSVIHCGEPAPRVFSAPHVKVPLVTVSRAGREDSGPPPGAYSTRAIGDGMPVHKWRAERSKRRRRDARDALHKALKSS
jgi:hypothetical protein